ncbi:hypothetical protein ACIOHS_43945 [Streptomyces sp. NPDC088253]|uniref:hypothetical protein n=1 Tax=Streptomyces sp. NPDC088253 TaxID=3365846 RepID=UPI00382CB011
MFKHIRRRRATSARPLRLALHGSAVSVSSACFGYGTTFLGADAPTAAGMGLAFLPIVLTFFPLPSRKGSNESAQLADDSSSMGRKELADDDKPSVPACAPDEDAQDKAEPKSATHTEVTAPSTVESAPNSTSATESMPDSDIPVLVWEPRLEIKPRVTVHPIVFKETAEPGAAPATPLGEAVKQRVQPDEAI